MKILKCLANLYNTLREEGLELENPVIGLYPRDFDYLEAALKKEFSLIYPHAQEHGKMRVHGFEFFKRN